MDRQAREGGTVCGKLDDSKKFIGGYLQNSRKELHTYMCRWRVTKSGETGWMAENVSPLINY